MNDLRIILFGGVGELDIKYFDEEAQICHVFKRNTLKDPPPRFGS